MLYLTPRVTSTCRCRHTGARLSDHWLEHGLNHALSKWLARCQNCAEHVSCEQLQRGHLPLRCRRLGASPTTADPPASSPPFSLTI